MAASDAFAHHPPKFQLFADIYERHLLQILLAEYRLVENLVETIRKSHLIIEMAANSVGVQLSIHIQRIEDIMEALKTFLWRQGSRCERLVGFFPAIGELTRWLLLQEGHHEPRP